MENKFLWKDLINYHLNPPKKKILRTSNIERKYIDFKIELNKNNISITDYIKNNFFKDNEEFVFLKNNFPYNLENDILHYVLWFNNNFTNNNNFPKDLNFCNDYILECIKKCFTDFENFYFIFFENNVNNRSIGSYRHVQIFLKKK